MYFLLQANMLGFDEKYCFHLSDTRKRDLKQTNRPPFLRSALYAKQHVEINKNSISISVCCSYKEGRFRYLGTRWLSCDGIIIQASTDLGRYFIYLLQVFI